MGRLTPDANDTFIWLLNETSGAYKNTGSVLTNDPSTDLTISGTIVRTATGVFNGNCPYFPGQGNFPSGASATRNYIFGFESLTAQPPFTVSFWVNQRNYINNGAFQTYVKKLFRQHTTTPNYNAPFTSWEIANASGNSGQDLFFAFCNSATTRDTRTIIDFPMPIGQWNHIGMTHDGTNIRHYLNGCQLMAYSGTTQLLEQTATADGIVYSDIQYAITQTSGATYVPGVDDIGNHGDEVMTTISLPFPFTIYGAAHNEVSCSSNGFISFGSTTNAFNWNIPNTSLGACVCTFQNDGGTSNTGFGIFTTTTGVAPNRVFIIEYRNRQLGNNNTQNSTIRLIEGSATFEIIYGTSTSTDLGKIGIQSHLGGKSTVFSNSTTIPAAGTKLTFTPSNSFAPGALVIGASPLYTSTSSSTKEEPNFMIQDVRIANVARSLDYFKNVYRIGALPTILSEQIQYYKLKVYDLSCPTPTPVTWVDTEVSLANVPSFPCSGPYSSIEILDSWWA